MPLPANNFVALKTNERCESMVLRHFASSRYGRLNNDLIPRGLDTRFIFTLCALSPFSHYLEKNHILIASARRLPFWVRPLSFYVGPGK